MSCERKRLLTMWVVIVTVLFFTGPQLEAVEKVAQRNRPSAGVTGGARLYPRSGANRRASRRVRHARDYSRDIYRYSRDVGRIEPTVAKAESEELGRNIAKAQQELTTASKEVGIDPATLAALKSINEHLAAAAKQHQMLHKECCKASVHGTTCMKHCNQILLELDKAQAEHDALMRTLEIQQQPSK